MFVCSSIFVVLSLTLPWFIPACVCSRNLFSSAAVLFHCVGVPRCTSPFYRWWTFRLFPVFCITGSMAANILICVSWCMWARISLGNRLEVDWPAFGILVVNFYFIDHASIKHPFARQDLIVIGEQVDSQALCSNFCELWLLTLLP